MNHLDGWHHDWSFRGCSQTRQAWPESKQNRPYELPRCLWTITCACITHETSCFKLTPCGSILRLSIISSQLSSIQVLEDGGSTAQSGLRSLQETKEKGEPSFAIYPDPGYLITTM